MLLNEIQSPDAELNKIVRFTNKTDFDFTPEMGAKYNGIPYFLAAGKSMLAPKPMAYLLAKHLARQTFIKKAPIRDEKELDGKGKDRPLWTEEEVQATALRFVSDEYEEERVAPKTEAEILAERVARLNETFSDEENKTRQVSSVSTNASESQETQPHTYADKAEVIEELKRRNIAYDARSSKANLEKLLA